MRRLFVYALIPLMTYTAVAQSTAPQVTVWLYRPSSDNSGLPLTLHMDGRKLTNLGHGQFFGIQVSPGLHKFTWINQSGTPPVVITIDPQEQTYLEVTFRTNAPFLFIEQASGDKAVVDMSGLRPVNRNGVFDSSVIIPAQAIQPVLQPAATESATAAKEAPVSASPEQNVVPAVSSSVPEPVISDPVTEPDNPSPPPSPASVHGKTQKQTIWVTALIEEPNGDSRTSTHQISGRAGAPCGGAITTSALTTSNVSCFDAGNPTQEHNRNLWKVDVVNKVKAENGPIYTIGCTANWFGSNCASLIAGDKFKAELENATMWIIAQTEGKQRKQVRIKYRILDVQ